MSDETLAAYTRAMAAQALVAGRELDSEIAELVMERRHITGADLPPFLQHRDEPESEQEAWVSEDGKRYYCRACGTLPDFSRSIAAAWLVVEKMRGHPNPRFRTLRLVAYSYNRTYATFDAENEDDWTEANGEYATPLAICRAAISAVAR